MLPTGTTTRSCYAFIAAGALVVAVVLYVPGEAHGPRALVASKRRYKRVQIEPEEARCCSLAALAK